MAEEHVTVRPMEPLRQALRSLRSAPAFTAAAALILAAGIASNTVMFSIVSGVLLRPLPFAQPERLVSISELRLPEGTPTRVAPPVLMRLRNEPTGVTVAGYSEYQPALLGGGEPERVDAAAVSYDFFEILGRPVAQGRSFRAEEDAVGGPAVVVIGQGLWHRRYGADPGMIGRTLTLEGTPHTVVGIAAAGFDYPDRAQLWTPLAPAVADAIEVAGAKYLRAIGRVETGEALESLERRLAALVASTPDNDGWGARLTPLHSELTSDVRSPLILLMSAVGLVLLISCANVGSLLLARGAARGRDIAVRAALGADRARIARELLAESVLIAAAAGVVGVIAARWALDLVLRIEPGGLPRASDIAIDLRVLAFSFSATLATALLAGAAPALRGSAHDLAASLRAHGATGVDPGRARIRTVLIVAQVALSVVLLAGAGVLARSFVRILNVDPGFRAEHVTAFDLELPAYRYAEPHEWLAFIERLSERVDALPGIAAVAATQNAPLTGRNIAAPVVVAGRDAPAEERAHAAAVSPSYFEAMGTRRVGGRAFDARDARGAPPVAIVNETFARTFLPGRDPLGAQVRTLFGNELRTIVGVVADVRQTSLTRDPEPILYAPLAQDVRPFFTLLVRSATPVDRLVPAVRAAIRAIDPGQPIGTIATMDEWISRSIARPRFHTLLLGSFALTAVALAMAGLYAVMAQLVVQRSREIGIRIALGARASGVMRMTLAEGLRLALLGAAVGFPVALFTTRLLASLLFGVAPADPLTFAGVALLLLAAAALASLLPAWRAARTDPVRVLGR